MNVSRTIHGDKGLSQGGPKPGPETTVQNPIWGAAPSRRYDDLAAPFRPVFRRIREGATQRERDRVLPFEQIQWLKDAGFGAVRAPKEYGGGGATLPELFALLAELAEADSNLTQALRVHFAYVRTSSILRIRRAASDGSSALPTETLSGAHGLRLARRKWPASRPGSARRTDA
jgi:alkylation response protein AidB-like acyl-CoA dehydrogenase